jgi:hypothetical protein
MLDRAKHELDPVRAKVHQSRFGPTVVEPGEPGVLLLNLLAEAHQPSQV